jgi:uncharacterized protein YuzE
MRLEFDTESGALYIGVYEGRVEQTLDPRRAGACASMDADGEGNVFGVEFTSLKECTERVTCFGGVLATGRNIGPRGSPYLVVAATEVAFRNLTPEPEVEICGC